MQYCRRPQRSVGLIVSDETGLKRGTAGAYLLDIRIPAAFMVRKGNPGFGWVVDVLWPDGETEVVQGFATEQQAAEWIAKHSEGWQGNTK